MGILIVGGYVVLLAVGVGLLWLHGRMQRSVDEQYVSTTPPPPILYTPPDPRNSEIAFLRSQVLELTLQLATARGDLARQLEMVLNPPAPETDTSPAPPADHVPDPSEAMTDADTADWTDEWFKGGLEDGVVPPPPEELGGL